MHNSDKNNSDTSFDDALELNEDFDLDDDFLFDEDWDDDITEEIPEETPIDAADTTTTASSNDEIQTPSIKAKKSSKSMDISNFIKTENIKKSKNRRSFLGVSVSLIALTIVSAVLYNTLWNSSSSNFIPIISLTDPLGENKDETFIAQTQERIHQIEENERAEREQMRNTQKELVRPFEKENNTGNQPIAVSRKNDILTPFPDTSEISSLELSSLDDVLEQAERELAQEKTMPSAVTFKQEKTLPQQNDLLASSSSAAELTSIEKSTEALERETADKNKAEKEAREREIVRAKAEARMKEEEKAKANALAQAKKDAANAQAQAQKKAKAKAQKIAEEKARAKEQAKMAADIAASKEKAAAVKAQKRAHVASQAKKLKPIPAKKALLPNIKEKPSHWEIRAAQADYAVLYDKSTGHTQTVEPGNDVHGLGRIRAITQQEDGRWIILGTQQNILQ